MQNVLDVMSLDDVITDSSSANRNTDTPPVLPATALPPLTNIAAIEHVRLPVFWRYSPQQWFTHAEAIFHTNRIKSDLTRVNHVLSALDEGDIRTVSDLLGVDIRYETLRSRLIAAYVVPQATRFRTIVQLGGMVDRQLSQMLRDMRSVLPDGIGDDTLKEFWLQKLPPAIRTVISGLDGSLESLAERADRVMNTNVGHNIAAVSTSNEPDSRFRCIKNAILALTAQIATFTTMQPSQNRSRSGNGHRSSSRTRSRSRPRNDGWCFYHNRFGKDAMNCRGECTFHSENQ